MVLEKAMLYIGKYFLCQLFETGEGCVVGQREKLLLHYDIDTVAPGQFPGFRGSKGLSRLVRPLWLTMVKNYNYIICGTNILKFIQLYFLLFLIVLVNGAGEIVFR